MINQTIIVGRLVNEPQVEETKNGNLKGKITLAVPRYWKNANGEYETDFIDCILWNSIIKNAIECIKKGDVIGIKGYIQSRQSRIVNDKKIMEVIAEKVSFVAGRRKEDE